MRLPNWLIRLAWVVPFLSFIAGYALVYKLYGSKTITMPSLVGMSAYDLIKAISTTGLGIKIIGEKEDPNLPSGTIISHLPKEGTKIKRGQTVFCAVSKKPERRKAPNFVGKCLSEITTTALNQKLRNRSYTTISHHPAGVCIAQHPEAGSEMDDDRIITYLSCGPSEHSIVPDLRKCSVEEALSYLTGTEVTLKLFEGVDAIPATKVPKCRIKDQKPLPGTIVPHNKPLTIEAQIVKK